jgi:hypothetical protein
VRVDCATPDGPWSDRYDLVVNCTGFDVLAQARELFPDEVRDAIEQAAGPVWSASAGEELRFGRSLELAGLRPRLHIPGLANVSQGPGFANLGCLGLTADRVLAPVLLGDSASVAAASPAAVWGA